MRIRKLQIHGFKSFADRATVLFDSPVCGVVGPNGVGKTTLLRLFAGEDEPSNGSISKP